jgi:hypothetical protein
VAGGAAPEGGAGVARQFLNNPGGKTIFLGEEYEGARSVFDEVLSKVDSSCNGRKFFAASELSAWAIDLAVWQ